MDKQTGLAVRLVVIISALLVGANLLLGMVLMANSSASMKTLMSNRMLDISNTAADMLDGDELEKLTAEDKGTPEYQRVNDTLAYFQDNIELKYIYCITDKGDGNFVFSVDPTIEDPGVFGEPVVYTDALFKASNGTPAVDDKPYTDEWGSFYSAYSPVFDSKGHVAGIVAVDFDAAWYDWQITKQALVIFFGCFVAMIIGILLIVITSRRMRKMITSDINEQAHKMITALSSDYRSVYYIDLDKDRGICYQPHKEIDNGLKRGEEFSYSQVLTRYARDFVTDKYREEFLKFIEPEEIKKALEKERIITLRYTVSRNCQESYEMLKMAGVRHPGDRTDHKIHAVGMGFSDVDAETRRTLNQSQALSDALTAAESANKAKTAFLSNMSHEIRTPMNAIISFDRIALENENLSDDVRDQLEKIGTSADHLLKIINDILDMSRIEAGKMVLKNDVFSFRSLLEQVDVMIGGQCRDKGLKWELKVIGQTDEFYVGDDMKLKQVILNILGNAVKFTPEGGSVTFSAERIAHYETNSVFRFIMKDTGVGMSKEYLPKLFDPFSQEDYSTKNKYGSAGLGMSITKSIVEMMNGDIKVGSNKGAGSTFTVTISLADYKPENYRKCL